MAVKIDIRKLPFADLWAIHQACQQASNELVTSLTTNYLDAETKAMHRKGIEKATKYMLAMDKEMKDRLERLLLPDEETEKK